jgi:hypothetical protein
MYVDNTGLVHWSSMPSCTPTELIAALQTATYAWGGLAIATGAAMKPEKCYAYFLLYWYNHGRAKLRTVKALPNSIAPITLPSGKIAPLHLRVPLRDGMSAPIPTLQKEHASLMLGIFWSNIWRQYPHSGNGKKRLCVVQPNQISPAPTRPCMEEFYPPAPTRNDVGNCYSCLVSPEAIETVPTGVLSMSPAFKHEPPC